jgi:hypothetical protein
VTIELCLPDRVFGAAIAKSAKRQRIADQIKTALITARPNFTDVHPHILCSDEQSGDTRILRGVISDVLKSGRRRVDIATQNQIAIRHAETRKTSCVA